MNKSYLEKIPIPEPNHRLSVLSERMLELHKKLGKAKVPTEKERLQREIGATDKQIDTMVYELYGLTPDEIAIVEGRDKTNWWSNQRQWRQWVTPSHAKGDADGAKYYLEFAAVPAAAKQ